MIMDVKIPKVDIKGILSYNKALTNAYTKLNYLWLSRRQLVKSPKVWIGVIFVTVIMGALIVAATYKKPLKKVETESATPKPTAEPVVVKPSDRFDRSPNENELVEATLVDVVGTIQRQGVTSVAYFTSVERSDTVDFASPAPNTQRGLYEFEVRNKYNQKMIGYKFDPKAEEDGVNRFRFTISLPPLTNSILFKLIENGKIYDRLYLSCDLFFVPPCTN